MLDKKSLFVFPTSRAIKEYLSGFKTQNTLLPTTLSIDEFLKKSINLDGYKYINDEQRVIFLNESIKNIDLSKLGVSKSFTKFLKQSEYIYRFFLELSSEKVLIEDIIKVDTYEFYSEHLDILNEIYKNYIKLLNQNQYIDRVNLDSFYTINSDFVKRFNNITIVFEGYFTKQEFEIIQKISEETDIYIEFVSNIYNQKSLQVFDYLNYKFKIDYRYKIDLNKKEIIEEILLVKEEKTIELKGFSTRFNQLAFIKSTIVNLVNSGINPSAIAIILPNEKFAEILELNDNEEYFNFAMGKSILSKNLYQKINNIYLYINSSEIENIEALNYFQIDKNYIDDNIKPHWQKRVTKDFFINLCNYLKNSEEDLELIEKYDELIYKLSLIFFTNQNNLRLKDAYKIVLQELSAIKLDDAHSGKITVMGVLETRAIKFEAVIICDFNEEFIPKVSLKDKFLSSSVKAKSNLPTSKDRENLQKYYYKRLIDNSNSIYISYVSSNSSEISRFAYELFGFVETSINDKIYEDILYKTNKLVYLNENISLDIDLTKQIWSASSLKIFLECKRRWYLRYILKIKEHTISKLPKAFELGNIIHKVLEEFYKNSKGDFTKIEELFLKYKSDNPFLILDLEVFKQKIIQFLKDDEKRLENRTIVELEKSFNTTFNGFNISGVIDRVDKFEDSYELIDYKTSRNLKVDTLRTYEKSCDFQLEFYYIAIKNLYENQNVKAFYYDLFENSLKEEIVLYEKVDLLKAVFDELKVLSEKKIDFCKTEDKTVCEYCAYKTICNKE